jgi:hypothetical protein
MEYSALTYLAQKIAKYITVQQNVQQVESGVEALLQGQVAVSAAGQYKSRE